MSRSAPPIARPPLVVHTLVILIGLTATRAASAQSMVPRCTPTDDPNTKTVVITGERGTFDIDVHKDVVATVELPGKISRVVFPRHIAKKFWYDLSKDRTTVEFKPKTFRTGRQTTLTLTSDDAKVTAIAHIRAVNDATLVKHSLYRVCTEDPAAACKRTLAPDINQKVQVQHERDLAEFEAERKQDQERHQREKRDQATRARREARKAAARLVLNRATRHHNGIPLTVIDALSNPHVALRIFEPEWNGDEFLIPFELENRTGAPLTFTDVQAVNTQGVALNSEVLELRGLDQPGPGPSALPVSVSHDARIRGVLGLPSATKSDVTPLRLSFIAANSKPTVAMAARWYPADSESIRRERRMSQTTLSIGAIGGGLWFSDGVDPASSSPAGIVGLAARLQKGYYWGGAIEASLAGARTGLATFDAVDWNGTQGDVTRQANIVRATGTFAVRFGYKYMFTGRAGAGFQLATNRSRFLPDTGAETTGPADGIAIDGFWTLGGQFDTYLAKNWSLGLETAFIGVATRLANDGIRGSFEAGIQLRYHWRR